MSFRSINKYEPNWQLTRVVLKQEKNFSKKLELLEGFLKANQFYEDWGRAINWLEGLKRGYKNSSLENVQICSSIILEPEREVNELPRRGISIDLAYTNNIIQSWTIDSLSSVWVSLYAYEKDFTSRGYRHKQLEVLVDALHQEFLRRGVGVEGFVKNYRDIKLFRLESVNKKSSGKKFFF